MDILAPRANKPFKYIKLSNQFSCSHPLSCTAFLKALKNSATQQWMYKTSSVWVLAASLVQLRSTRSAMSALEFELAMNWNFARKRHHSRSIDSHQSSESLFCCLFRKFRVRCLFLFQQHLYFVVHSCHYLHLCQVSFQAFQKSFLILLLSNYCINRLNFFSSLSLMSLENFVFLLQICHLEIIRYHCYQCTNTSIVITSPWVNSLVYNYLLHIRRKEQGTICHGLYTQRPIILILH